MYEKNFIEIRKIEREERIKKEWEDSIKRRIREEKNLYFPMWIICTFQHQVQA